MNLKFEKKEYVAPKMTFIDMRGDLYLLASSGPEADEYDDEFGFNLGKGTDRHV